MVDHGGGWAFPWQGDARFEALNWITKHVVVKCMRGHDRGAHGFGVVVGHGAQRMMVPSSTSPSVQGPVTELQLGPQGLHPRKRTPHPVQPGRQRSIA